MSDMKTASYQVAATAGQCARWEPAAEAAGHLSADTWLAAAADAYLKARATAGPPVPLAWHRGPFKVLLMDGREIEVHGMLSPPFGAYQG